MYGVFGYDIHITRDDVAIDLSEEEGFFSYRRKSPGESLEKRILSHHGSVIINPVEPLNVPREITTFLEIQFDPVMVEPNSAQRIYLTFPVEIGVFVSAKRELEILDIFTLTVPKYSLYGMPTAGIITRWHKSPLFHEIPGTDPYHEGVIELTIRNPLREWVEVSRAVFESHAMKIYYGDLVSMVAQMKILTKQTAETSFVNKPIAEGMEKSVELYTTRDLPVVKKVFEMEWGLI